MYIRMRQVETGVTASKSLHIRNSNRIIFIFPYNLIMLLVSVQSTYVLVPKVS